MSYWILKAQRVCVQCLSSALCHLPSSVFPVGTPCPSICQGQLLYILPWQLVLFENDGACSSASLPLYYPPFCPVITSSHFAKGQQIHCQSLYHEQIQVVWEILMQHFIKVYLGQSFASRKIIWIQTGFQFCCPKTACCSQKRSLSQSHPQVPSCPVGMCELASWEESCLEFSQTAPAAVGGYEVLNFRLYIFLSVCESSCPLQHLSQPPLSTTSKCAKQIQY